MASQFIGNYQFPVSEVLVIERRTGLAGWLRPGFTVHLRGGLKLYLTETDKNELDKAMNKHQQIAIVAGMIAKAQGKRPGG